MISPAAFLRSLGSDTAGSTVIETALVMPPLLALSLGSFEMSRMIARQSDLQKAANEASDIVRAAFPDTQSKRDTIKSVIQASTGLANDKVSISVVYRCFVGSDYVTYTSSCSATNLVLIKLTITDSYSPIWRNYGVGSVMNYTVTRYVQLG